MHRQCMNLHCLCLTKKGTWTQTRCHFDTQIIPIDPLTITHVESCDDTEKRALFAWFADAKGPMRQRIFPNYPNGGEAL